MFSQINVLYPKRAVTSAGSAIASQSLTVSTAAVAFSTTFNDVTQLVTFDIQGVDVRCRWDGTDPTGTVGHILPGGTAYTWDAAQAAAAKFIRISTATSDATIFLSELQN